MRFTEHPLFSKTLTTASCSFTCEQNPPSKVKVRQEHCLWEGSNYCVRDKERQTGREEQEEERKKKNIWHFHRIWTNNVSIGKQKEKNPLTFLLSARVNKRTAIRSPMASLRSFSRLFSSGALRGESTLSRHLFLTRGSLRVSNVQPPSALRKMWV